MALVYSANIVDAVTSKSGRDLRPRAAPIRIISAEQNAVHFCISGNIVRVRGTARVTVMRVLLIPLTRFILEIDIVAKGLLLTTRQVRFFTLESLVFPISIERHCLGYAHDVNEVPLSAVLPAAGTDDPVVYGTSLSNSRLTRSQSAYPEEWIGCKSIIPNDYV